MSKVIVTISGGKASAWCAHWAIKRYGKENVTLYFNNTKWEHPDLHRFLYDLENYFNHPITHDSDGRSPEQLFYDNNSLANNRMPFCSRILKAKRLQAYYQNGDTLIFGIGSDEQDRANRLVQVYQVIAAKTGKYCKLEFPLISNNVTSSQVDNFITSTGIQEPLLYRLGFTHNNCSGGCVRAGKKHWKLLYNKLPEVYLNRERVENDLRNHTGKDIHFFKDETLTNFRHRIITCQLSRHYDNNQPEVECIGICHTQN